MKRLFRRFFFLSGKIASDVPGSPAASLQRYRKTSLWLIEEALSRSDSKSNLGQNKVGPAKNQH